MSRAMASRIPGVLSVDVNPPLTKTHPAGKGFDLGTIVTLETSDDLARFEQHEDHQALVSHARRQYSISYLADLVSESSN